MYDLYNRVEAYFCCVCFRISYYIFVIVLHVSNIVKRMSLMHVYLMFSIL